MINVLLVIIAIIFTKSAKWLLWLGETTNKKFLRVLRCTRGRVPTCLAGNRDAVRIPDNKDVVQTTGRAMDAWDEWHRGSHRH